ncbi:MAG: RNA polymerase sigma factor [Deltaproteobacteria bacterium]|nr:RNA polymerase sigma factor [Deltaproteobacteria bacterium]
MPRDFKDPGWLRREARLLAKIRAGDRRALGALYREMADPLCARVILPRVGGDLAAAEDVLADTFISAIERLDRFEARGTSIYFWLGRIAANKAVDLHRGRARGRRALERAERMMGALASTAPAPDEAADLDLQSLRARIRTVLAGLNDRYRKAIELRFLAGRSREDCARALDVKLGTFDVLVLRALRSFRKRWDELEADDALASRAREEHG